MIAPKPPMGFNTWNTFGKNINEELIREIADCFAQNGLREAGYEYIVIDDCWSEMERDPDCRPAFEVSAHPWIGGRKAYFRFLKNGEYALGLVNFSDSDGEVPFYTYSAGLGEGYCM